MKATIRMGVKMAMLAASVIATGCAMTGEDLNQEDAFKIEKVSSTRCVVTFASITRKEADVMLRGVVKRKRSGRGGIPGHIDIEVLEPSGTTLGKIRANYRRRSMKSQYADFYIRLEMTPPPGSIIRVIHHDQNHDEPN